jgi:hypothetical protein
MGYSGDEVTADGLRSSASTFLNESCKCIILLLCKLFLRSPLAFLIDITSPDQMAILSPASNVAVVKKDQRDVIFTLASYGHYSWP